MPITIPISKKPYYIIVTVFSDGTEVHYRMDTLKTRNKVCDVGVWRIKYKECDGE
ncbi:MAG: hypothetical protein KG003_10050 [Bacteroidetes bacterium]|nr:hypothetical protein [Bacteroidota bacterium]